MYEKNRSGQWLYFGMVSALSGNPVASIASGNISGRVSLDGGAQAVAAGPINEIGGGQYVLGMYAGDINARIAGFFFTASGCVPVSFTAITSENVSGRIYPNSGLAVGVLSGAVVGVFSGNLSGQLVTAASGVFGTASLNSGQSVLVYSGQLSGQPITLLSGRSFIASGHFATVTSGTVYLGSGSYVHTAANYQEGSVWYNAASTNTNTVYPFDGTAVNAVNTFGRALTVLGQMPQPARGVFSMNGSQVTLLSGLFGFRLDGDAWNLAPGGFGLASTVVTHGFVSGTVAASTSGGPPVFETCPIGLSTLPPCVMINCGIIDTLTLNGSGGYTMVDCFSEAQGASTATINLVSGTGLHSLKIRNWRGGLTLQNITSGDVVTIDGMGGVSIMPTCVGGTLLLRGNFTLTNSGNLLTFNDSARFGSGNVYHASGRLSGFNVVAQTVLDKSGYTAGLISGVNYVASGHFTVASLNSGQPVIPYSGQMSGQPVVVASGLSTISTLYSGQSTISYSGQLSGQQVTARTVMDKTGYTTLSGTDYLGSGQLTQVTPQAIFTWDFSGAPDTSGIRCSLEAQRKLINRWSLTSASGYLRVYKEDDSTTAYDQSVTSASGAPPITSLDTE